MNIVVVIVTYNAMPWLERCLGSIQSSNIPLECIIIDNGSNDGTQEKIKRYYPDINFIQSDVNIGFGQANNIGMKKAYDDGADYILLMNQDTWILPDTLEKLLEGIMPDNKMGIISPMHLNGSGKDLDYNFKKYIAEAMQNAELFTVNFVNAACWLISRECLKKVGGFSPYFYHYGEDRDYVNRLRFHGFSLAVASKALVYHDRPQSDSPTKLEKMKRLWKEMEYLNPNITISWQEVQRKMLSTLLWNTLKFKLYAVWYNIRTFIYFQKQWKKIQPIKEQVLRKTELLFLK